jgi:hypothetical protein
MQQICQKLEFSLINFNLISNGYNSVWSDERIVVKILEESVIFLIRSKRGGSE